jgi:hypothetical protein
MSVTSSARRFIERALRIAQITAAGETPSAEDAQAGLDMLNGMLDSWETSNINLHDQEQLAFNLTAGQGVYTIGAGQNFNVSPPPISFNYMFLRVLTNPQQPLDLPIKQITAPEFAEIQLKQLGNTYPGYSWYNYGPIAGTVNLWPLPIGNTQLVIGYKAEFSSFATLDTTASFPSGYDDAIVYSLAERICAEYGRPITPDLARMAREARAAMKSTNLAQPKLKFEYGVKPEMMTLVDFLRGY